MDTFKQYVNSTLNEMGWNPRAQMKSPGDPSRLREPTRASGMSGGGDVDETIETAEEVMQNPDAFDLQQAQNILDELGRSFKPAPDDMKEEIIQKYRKLRDMLKMRAASMTAENVTKVVGECIYLAKQMKKLLVG